MRQKQQQLQKEEQQNQLQQKGSNINQVTKHIHKVGDGAHSLLLFSEQRRRFLVSNYLANRKNYMKHSFGIM